MAGDYYFTEDSSPAVPTGLYKFLKVFIVAMVVCMGGMLIWLFGIGPFKPFSRIDITSHGEMSRDMILTIAGINGDSSYFSTDVQLVERALMSVSSIETVNVFMRFPDRLHIVIETRRPVASALATLNGVTVPVMFDSQGVIFQIGTDEMSYLSKLPIISGIVIEDPFLGMRLPPQFVSFFRELERIDMFSPHLFEAISEIRIDLRPFNSYDLILYPVHRRIKIRLSELNEDVLRYALLIVDVLASREDEIDFIDFRSGIASYIPKEASL